MRTVCFFRRRLGEVVEADRVSVGVTLFHIKGGFSPVNVHHAFFLFKLILDFSHFLLDVRRSCGDGETFLQHLDAKNKEE